MRVRAAFAALAILSVGGAACTESPRPENSATTGFAMVGADGDTLYLPGSPQRIVALIPAVNDILIELGALDRIVGRTDYDTVTALAALPSVGGGLGADLEVLSTLQPDLVIRFEGVSDARTTERMSALGIPNIGLRPDGIDDIRSIIHQMGRVIGASEAATEMVDAIDAGLDEVRNAVQDRQHPSVAYLLGGSPPLAAGPGTFLDQLVGISGGTNAYADLGGLYEPVSIESAITRDIDVVVLTEGTEVDARLIEGRLVGRVPSWVQIPGPAIVEAAWAVAMAIHPGLSR